MIKVIVAGAAGRMGSRLVGLIKDSAALTLAGAIEGKGHQALGEDAGETAGCGKISVPITEDLPALLKQGEVVIDFSTPDATMNHLRAVVQQRRAMVIGHNRIQRTGAGRTEIDGPPDSLRMLSQHERGRESHLQGHRRDGENLGR